MLAAPAHSPLLAASRRGFTLIEVMLGTAIVAVLVGALYSVFHGALRLRETTFSAVESTMPVDYAERTIRRDLAAALPPAGLMVSLFQGASDNQSAGRMDHIDFFAASGGVTDTEPWGDVQEVQYYLSEPGDTTGLPSSHLGLQLQAGKGKSMDLVRATRRNLLASVAEDPVEEHLLQGVASLTITYYDGASWQDDWDSSSTDNTNPVAVKFVVTFEEPTAATGPAAPRRTPPLEIVCELTAKPPTTTTPTPTS